MVQLENFMQKSECWTNDFPAIYEMRSWPKFDTPAKILKILASLDLTKSR